MYWIQKHCASNSLVKALFHFFFLFLFSKLRPLMATYNGLSIWVSCVCVWHIDVWWRGVVCEERKWMELAQLRVVVLERDIITELAGRLR